MAYDEFLSKQIDELIKGKRCLGVHKNELIIRYAPKKTEEIKAAKNVHAFDLPGRPMKGWSLVSSEGVKGNELKRWFDLSFNFAKSLPPKK